MRSVREFRGGPGLSGALELPESGDSPTDSASAAATSETKRADGRFTSWHTGLPLRFTYELTIYSSTAKERHPIRLREFFLKHKAENKAENEAGKKRVFVTQKMKRARCRKTAITKPRSPVNGTKK